MLWGGQGQDLLHGLGGHDELHGEDNVVQLFAPNIPNHCGLGDSDTLVGGAGNDRLEGGYDGAIDTLTGGDGIDTFVQYLEWVYFDVAIEAEIDDMDDFVHGTDKISWQPV